MRETIIFMYKNRLIKSSEVTDFLFIDFSIVNYTNVKDSFCD